MKNPRNIVGPQLRRLRLQQKLTQQALADRCQVAGWDLSRDTLAKIEAQIRWVSDFELAFFAWILKVPAQMLLPDQPRLKAAVLDFIGRLETTTE
ncbi:MAG: helix-turn-helix transcriptional regulator [Chthoniobacteraceae bacterium]